MSKTKYQVNRYITHCRFPDDDWQKVLTYCRSNKLGYAHKAAHPRSGSSYSQFLEWIESGYGAGDVVRYGHTIGILSTCTPEYSELCAYYTADRKLLISNLQISNDRIMPSTNDDAKMIYGDLRMLGMDFDERLSIIHERLLPKPYMRISYSYNNVHGYGVISEYEGNYAHFLFGIEGKKVRLDFNIPVYELTAKPVDKNDVVVMNDMLAVANLRWNVSLNQLETIGARAVLGAAYWYITDKFTIGSAIENGTPTCNVRHENGNYFIDFKEASDFLQSIHNMRKKDINK